MTSDQKGSTALEQNSEIPIPPPPQFDEAMIAAAQPVEPLAINQTRKGRQLTVRGSLKTKLIFIAAVLVATFLSAAFGGILFRLKGVAHSPEGEVAAPVASQSPVEMPSAVTPAPSVKISDNLSRKSRRPPRVAPVAADLAPPGDNEKPVARKVGVILFGTGKEAHKRQRDWRRHGDNDNDH